MRTVQSILSVLGVVALFIIYGLVTGWNPWPKMLDWLNNAGSLAKPETDWKTRAGEKPNFAVLADGAVVVVTRGTVEAHDARTGDELWSRETDSAAVAGADSAAVVMIGRGRGHGYEAVDPSDGSVRWADDEALGVWTYREIVLDMSCHSASECTVAGRTPASGDVLWQTKLPGAGRSLAGANQALLGSRPLTTSTVEALASAPQAVPALLGFPLGGKVQVLDPTSGRRVREAEPDSDTRVVVIGGRILYSTATGEQSDCRYELEARDAGSGRSLWRKSGYDVATASGAVCEQRRDPVGAGGAIVATRGGREVLLSAGDGRELWMAGPGEKALATDGTTVVVLAPDGKSIRAIDLRSAKALWQQQVEDNPKAALTREAVIIVEHGRVRAVEPQTGRLLIDVTTIAEVIGCGPGGIVLASGRTLGLLPFGSINSAD